MDIDECNSEDHDCNAETELCINNVGSYSCTPKQFYKAVLVLNTYYDQATPPIVLEFDGYVKYFSCQNTNYLFQVNIVLEMFLIIHTNLLFVVLVLLNSKTDF